MFGDNLLRVISLHMAIPDGLRVDHHHRAVFALIQATGLADPDHSVQPGSL